MYFKASLKLLWLTSCWYSPTPILFGSILTSSLSGSSTLLAIDIALLFSTVKSGNSSIASLLAEYTLAPASFVIMYLTSKPFIASDTNASLSLEAVPLPILISLTLYLLINSLKVLALPILSFLGSCG